MSEHSHAKIDEVNIGLQSHGGDTRTFYSNARMASLQPRTTEQLHGLSQPINAQDTGVTWVTNTCMTLTDPNRSITSTGTSSYVTSTCLQTPTITYLKFDGSPLIHRRGKVAPIDELTAEDKTVTSDDRLPILERAATWNGWSKEESLMQLIGHLRGRALQEWKLIDAKHKITNESAMSALRDRLDPDDWTLAALDFHYASQKATESISDFVTHVEKVFHADSLWM